MTDRSTAISYGLFFFLESVEARLLGRSRGAIVGVRSKFWAFSVGTGGGGLAGRGGGFAEGAGGLSLVCVEGREEGVDVAGVEGDIFVVVCVVLAGGGGALFLFFAAAKAKPSFDLGALEGGGR